MPTRKFNYFKNINNLYKDEKFYTSKSIFLNCKFDNNNLLI